MQTNMSFDLRQAAREWRHNPCLMGPLSACILLVMLLFSLTSLALKFPVAVLSLLLSFFLNRFQFIIEFLYPTSLGRWVHLTLVGVVKRAKKVSPHDKNRGYHSRTIEMRIEVIPDRVYLHPLPQWHDNLGYLVVSVPPPSSSDHEPLQVSETPLATVSVVQQDKSDIVAFVVDCGDAQAVVEQLELISEVHYERKPIKIQSILSTHKHHDHTAGNRGLMAHETVGKSIKLVFGGAVEKVPCCNFPLANGERLPLPKSGSNDMNELVEVEAVATPGHTRGSLAYILRAKVPMSSSAAAFLFTGDTMFSGGSGVPFEADVGQDLESKEARMTPNSFIKATASTYAVERCFSEILARCVHPDMVRFVPSDRVLILPGHEYTMELLSRQLSSGKGESYKWKNFSPSYFFETVSQLYVAMHRRALPHSSGRLISAPSSLRRELLINPQLRMLRKRGENVVRAIQFWHRHFAKEKIGDSPSSYSQNSDDSYSIKKTPSTMGQWNLDAPDINRPVFTTVFTCDLEAIIHDLNSEKITNQDAAKRLRDIQEYLETPAIGRRPIPDTLPSDRNVVKALLGFVLLGSSPTALTLTDSQVMKLPPPVVSSSDKIGVSRSRLVSILHWLGLLDEERGGNRIVAMIDQLWREGKQYSDNLVTFDPAIEAKGSNEVTYDTVEDVEVEMRTTSDDLIELGALRWVIFGIPQQSPSLFSKYCLPCAKPEAAIPPQLSHPVQKCGMVKHAGELVRHDIYECPICQSVAGCAGDEDADDAVPEMQCPKTKSTHLRRQTCSTLSDDQSMEMSQDMLNAIFHEA